MDFGCFVGTLRYIWCVGVLRYFDSAFLAFDEIILLARLAAGLDASAVNPFPEVAATYRLLNSFHFIFSVRSSLNDLDRLPDININRLIVRPPGCFASVSQ